MIRVAVVDRHPAVRTGMSAILGAAPDLMPAGTAADARELWPVLHRVRPDVVLVDHHPHSPAGLLLCLRISTRPIGPRVVVCAADAGAESLVPTTLAGARGMVDKSADPRDLLHLIRAVARGDDAMPRVTPYLQAQAAGRLEPRDRAILAMRLAGTSLPDIAATVGMDRRALSARVGTIVATLAGTGTTRPVPAMERAS